MSLSNLSLAPVLQAKTQTIWIWDACSRGYPRKWGVIPVPFSKRFQYLLGCSASKGPQQKLLQYLLRVGVEKIGHMSSFRIAPLTGAKHLKPCSQTTILVLLRGSYQDFRQAPHPFLYGSFSLSACYTGQSHPPLKFETPRVGGIKGSGVGLKSRR